MAKRKTTKKGGLFSFFTKKKKTTRGSKKSQPSISTGLKVTATIMVLAIIAGGGAVGLIYMDRYVQRTAAAATPSGSLKLIDPPAWIETQQLWIDKLVDTAGGMRFPLNDQAAQYVTQRLSALSWLNNIHVQTTPEYITVKADYRRPVGLVDIGRGKKYYLAEDMTVLEYLPIDSVPVIEITGIAAEKTIPEPGLPWRAEDAIAAVQLLDYLFRCDLVYLKNGQIQKPLLDEIESIDVSNFAARKSSSPNRPHIYLKVLDGTQVNWGAAIGQGNRYIEAKADKKCLKLYEHFVEHNNSLQGSAKWIELRQL